MNFWLCLLAAGLLFLAQPAAAESDLAFAWDLNLASTFAEPAASDDDACRPNPYALYRRGCADELNLGLERSSQHLSTLDQLLVLADRYKSLNLDTDIRPNTQVKFTLGLVDLYRQDAQARLTLKIRF